MTGQQRQPGIGAPFVAAVPIAVAAAAERERHLAELSDLLGRRVEPNTFGGVTISLDEANLLRYFRVQPVASPVSVFGIPIHIDETSDRQVEL